MTRRILHAVVLLAMALAYGRAGWMGEPGHPLSGSERPHLAASAGLGAPVLAPRKHGPDAHPVGIAPTRAFVLLAPSPIAAQGPGQAHSAPAGHAPVSPASLRAPPRA